VYHCQLYRYTAVRVELEVVGRSIAHRSMFEGLNTMKVVSSRLWLS